MCSRCSMCFCLGFHFILGTFFRVQKQKAAQKLKWESFSLQANKEKSQAGSHCWAIHFSSASCSAPKTVAKHKNRFFCSFTLSLIRNKICLLATIFCLLLRVFLSLIKNRLCLCNGKRSNVRNVCVSEMFGSLLIPDQVEAVWQALLIGCGGHLKTFLASNLSSV